MTQDKQAAEQETIIVGGGISGLMAAKAALERGEKNIRILEAGKDVGGKLISGKMSERFGGQTINMGAEFVDRDNEKIVALAKELGVALHENKDQVRELFQSPSGKMMPDFLKQFKPMHEAMAKLRERMEKDPDFANQVKGKSAAELMNELRKITARKENPTIFERFLNLVTFNDNTVPKEVVDTALSAAEKELGAKAENITAAQFLSEFSPEPDRFLASTCDYRVEGGTAVLIQKLKEYLKSKGVEFDTSHKLTQVQKTGEGNERELTFAVGSEGETKKIKTSKMIMALPAYALPKISWLGKDGAADPEMDFIKDIGEIQYTKNAKFTVALKPGVQLPTNGDNTFLSGSENWSPGDGLLTFLVHVEDGNRNGAREVMKAALENYASSFGMKADDLFYLSDQGTPVAGSFVYTHPGDAPCWSTPSPKNHQKMQELFAKMETMTQNGLGFVGTYIPLPTGGVGFMECGAAAAQRVGELMFGPIRELMQEMGMSMEMGHGLPQPAQLGAFADRVAKDRQAQNTGHGMAL